jgi:serine/threonine protein kinase
MSPNFDEQALDLLIQMVHLVPSKRISAKAALLHPYFDDLRTEESGVASSTAV